MAACHTSFSCPCPSLSILPLLLPTRVILHLPLPSPVQEVDRLLDMQSKVGNRWAHMVPSFTRRTEGALKNKHALVLKQGFLSTTGSLSALLMAPAAAPRASACLQHSGSQHPPPAPAPVPDAVFISLKRSTRLASGLAAPSAEAAPGLSPSALSAALTVQQSYHTSQLFFAATDCMVPEQAPAYSPAADDFTGAGLSDAKEYMHAVELGPLAVTAERAGQANMVCHPCTLEQVCMRERGRDDEQARPLW